MNPTSRRLNPALVIAIFALVLALGGSAVAAKRYLITNTKQISPAALKAIAKLASQQSSAGAPGAAGSPGSAGAPGTSGARGPAGPGAVVLWAVVNSNATLSRAGDEEASVTRVGEAEGTYVVHFSSDVTHCAYEAVLGRSGAESVEDPGFATVVRRAEDPNGVLVQTYDVAGTRVDKGFHLAVFC
jgi:hypothetical protein